MGISIGPKLSIFEGLTTFLASNNGTFVQNGTTKLKDRSGNSDYGELVDNVKLNLSLNFNNDGHILTTNSKTIRAVSLWVKPNNVFSGSTSEEILLLDGSVKFALGEHTNISGSTVFVTTNGTTTWDTTIESDKWTNIVFNYDGSEWQLYINGVNKTIFGKDGGGATIVPTITPKIGGDVNYYNGLMESIRIYNKSLTQNEINKIYNDDFDHIPFKVDISVSDLNIDQYDAVSFSGESNSNIVEYYWDFGDGFTSTEQNPVHVYPGGAGSTYTVRLIVKDNQNRVVIAVKEDLIEVQNDSYLGDKITNPEFIISLYKLTAQTTKAIRIRESNNNNETDIGYETNTPNAKIDVNAVNTFLSNNNASTAYIVQFYDQLDDSAILEETDASKQATLLTNDVGVQFVGGNRTESYSWLQTVTYPAQDSGEVFEFYLQGYKPSGGGSANRHNSNNYFLRDSIRDYCYWLDFNSCAAGSYPTIVAGSSDHIDGGYYIVTGYGIRHVSQSQLNGDFACFAKFNSQNTYQKGALASDWYQSRGGGTFLTPFYRHNQSDLSILMTSAIMLQGTYDANDKHRVSQNLNHIAGTKHY